jgi:hypothetical protein
LPGRQTTHNPVHLKTMASFLRRGQAASDDQNTND